MRRILCCAMLAVLPVMAPAADVQINVGSVEIQTGGATIRFGDRDRRGYYWDGKQWRDPVYWQKHHGKGKAQGQGEGVHCPPGQAKKGNCSPPSATPYR
ncbi:MAG: hypothetical protein FAZ92_02135 [Accumulibacter sp.]|uniref:DUF2502 domain-containing protein n=1 Tax=Accumulibacter sp. TaxID=2053492 RepID=UPI001229631E|nr:DUF2502 domain-containing protein [Accumulibacter sp.]QKS28832.1 MAG: DUF2502 domain-containing protein [Candidatus Accumulibacter similis]TLD45599.1 MAG: hypothetical protein FAZ92_02135 [Accumulibacter sp.]